MIVIMFSDHVAQILPLADRDISLRHGEQVFRVGAAVSFVFVVRAGAVRMIRRHPTGTALVIHRVPCGGLVAEASVFAERYHCEAVAEGQTLLARIPKRKVLELQCNDASWLQKFASHLASEVQLARARAELLSLPKVSQRVDAWSSINPGEIPERGKWAGWANELGVSPEALYRELSKRRS